jgi:hypothetical protein
MTFFLGCKGNVRLRRATSVQIGALQDQIAPSDVNLTLNRLSFDSAGENILTGDRIDISTSDPRGLLCFAPAVWSSGVAESSISVYANINAAGGLRFFPTFTDAVNNTRANELALNAFTGDPLQIECRVRDVSYTVLGNVTDYTLATDREAIDTTTLTDKFRQLYSAGLLSGSGSINCAFDYTTTGATETPLLMLQLIQRLELGSAFDCALYLTDSENDASVTDVFYLFDAMVTKAGVEVRAGDIINCTIDFVTTGEIKLLIGSIDEYILKEDDDRISLEQQSLDFLLKETED